jgi:hypothetical protein
VVYGRGAIGLETQLVHDWRQTLGRLSTEVVLVAPCSGRAALAARSAAQARLLQGRGPVGHVERADVGARRDDLVDLVDLVEDGSGASTGSFARRFIVVAPILLIQILVLALFRVEYARRTLDATR